MSSKKSIIAKLTCDPANAEALEEALAGAITASDEEGGLEIYSVHKDPNDAGVELEEPVHAGVDALGVHGKGDGMRAAMKAVGAHLSAPPEVSVLNPVVAKGLEL